MAESEPNNRPAIPEMNGIKATYYARVEHGEMSDRVVPVVGWTADGVALVATRKGQLVRATELPDFYGLCGAVMPDNPPYA